MLQYVAVDFQPLVFFFLPALADRSLLEVDIEFNLFGISPGACETVPKDMAAATVERYQESGMSDDLGLCGRDLVRSVYPWLDHISQKTE